MSKGYAIASLGALIGSPVGGAAQRKTGQVQSDFQGSWTFGGSFVLMAMGAMLVARYLRVGMRLIGKV